MLSFFLNILFVASVWSADGVVINEVELNPEGNDNYTSVNEWVELYNPTSNSIDIGGWEISTTHGAETHTVTIPQNTILEPNSYFVYERGSQWLDNNDESEILRNEEGTIINQTPQKSDEENDNRSWQRYPNSEDKWTFRSSTKGYSNGGESEPSPSPSPSPSSNEPETTEPEAPTEDIISVFVNDVIDGDTFDTAEGYRIRLADIDAPEIGETGYLQATEYLELLIENKLVTLDIDSVTGTDQYGRYVCLVYVQTNSTHSINVNQALVTEGYAEVDNYTNNEFDPDTWVLYYPTALIPEFPTWTPIIISLSIATIILILHKRKLEVNK